MNTRTIIYILGALLVGVLAGYLLFDNTADPKVQPAAHEHEVSGESSTEQRMWTCSMHPQIQRGEPGDCPICGMDLIPLAKGSNTDPAILTMTEAAVALARVRTVTVGGPLNNTGADAGARVVGGSGGPDVSYDKAGLELSGRLAADERTAAVEVSEFGGRIERLFVSFEGERVRAGQQIATVYSPDLVVAQEELLQAIEFVDVNPALVAAARAKLRNLKVTEAQVATLVETGEVISNFPVYADQSGTILATKAEVGEYVKAGGALYTYTNLSNLWVLFDAYEQDVARITVGDKVSFSVPSRPGETYAARVTFIDPVINPNTRTAAVRAEVSNRGGRLKPGMFVEGEIFPAPDPFPRGRGDGSAVGNTAIVVPRSAVLWTGERSVAYVELPDAEVPTYEFREITVGERIGEGYRITKGLSAGDRVVVNGAFQIDATAQLNNKASMMNRDVIIEGRKTDGVTALAIPNYREGTPELLRAQLGRVVEAYLSLKDRMVATQTADAGLVSPLLETLAEVDMSLITDEAHLYWMQQLKALKTHATALLEREEIDAQRKEFGFLSQALINVLTAFGVDETYYVQHCPMAFDNVGANWLSNEKRIRNPYFGDKMLTCGSVTETLN